MAVGVLEFFDAAFDDRKVHASLRAEIDLFGVNCLEIAYIGDCQKFLASSCVQNLLDKEWYGEVTNKSGLVTSFKVIYEFDKK